MSEASKLLKTSQKLPEALKSVLNLPRRFSKCQSSIKLLGKLQRLLNTTEKPPKVARSFGKCPNPFKIFLQFARVLRNYFENARGS